AERGFAQRSAVAERDVKALGGARSGGVRVEDARGLAPQQDELGERGREHERSAVLAARRAASDVHGRARRGDRLRLAHEAGGGRDDRDARRELHVDGEASVRARGGVALAAVVRARCVDVDVGDDAPVWRAHAAAEAGRLGEGAITVPPREVVDVRAVDRAA
ncbi:MAG: hypothetical protein ACK56I_24270, partial [bacterium]